MQPSSFNEDYVRRLTAGDPAVEKHFTDYFGALLLIKVRTRLRSEHLIDDVRQETFLRVLQALRKEGGLVRPERLGAFVNAVCNNVLMETYRETGKQSQMTEDTPERPDLSINLESELVTRERKDMVERILAELSPKDQELLRMTFLEELDKDDICKNMKVNSEYLRVLLHRAKTRFREAMARGNSTMV